MLVIVSGEVEYRSGDGRLLGRLERGQHLGELTALSGKLRPAGAVAISDVIGLSIDAASLSNLVLNRPEVRRQMLANLAVTLGEAPE